MKLTNIKLWDRIRLSDGREVNIHRGCRVGRSTEVYFYLHRMRRVFVSEQEVRTAPRVAVV